MNDWPLAKLKKNDPQLWVVFEKFACVTAFGLKRQQPFQPGA
jgi:hypothetical protein